MGKTSSPWDMKISLMLMDWQNQYCENGYSAKTINMFNAIPTVILMTFITEIEK
jgi:hypothetical protein